MQLKDCIHFYLGAKAKRFPEGAIVYITLWQLEQFDLQHCQLMPILRRLESMTGEECDKYNRISDSLFSLAEGVNQVRQASAAISYLINLGFDLFGLIESGEALDAETIKQSGNIH